MCQPAIDILPADSMQPHICRLLQSLASESGKRVWKSRGSETDRLVHEPSIGKNDRLSRQFRRFAGRPQFTGDPSQVIETGWRLFLPR